MAFEIVDGNLVPYRTQHAVTVFGENQVPLTVDRPQQVVELVIELHRQHFLEFTQSEQGFKRLTCHKWHGRRGNGTENGDKSSLRALGKIEMLLFLKNILSRVEHRNDKPSHARNLATVAKRY